MLITLYIIISLFYKNLITKKIFLNYIEYNMKKKKKKKKKKKNTK